MLAERWNCFAARLPGNAQAAEKMFNAIENSYGASNRYYHTLEHLEHCFEEMDNLTQPLEDWNAVELALWLHDIVYIPELANNEELSSAIGFCYGLELSADYRFAAAVRQLIQATAHGSWDGLPTGDKAIVTDIDLSILGSDEIRFACYETAIRKEYGHLSDVIYRKGRIKVLESFLAKQRIFQTDFFYSRYEEQSRRNIAKQLKLLTV